MGPEAESLKQAGKQVGPSGGWEGPGVRELGAGEAKANEGLRPEA